MNHERYTKNMPAGYDQGSALESVAMSDMELSAWDKADINARAKVLAKETEH